MADGASPSDPSLYPNLTAHLRSPVSTETRISLCDSVLPTLIHCVSSIATTLRASQKVSLVGTANAFGDDQLNVDVLAERIIRTEMAKCPSVLVAGSEEEPVERATRDETSEPVVESVE